MATVNKSSSDSKVSLLGTKYEVKCSETYAYYEGYVCDYDEYLQRLKVEYTWKADEYVDISWVRPPAWPTDPNWKPKKGDTIEAKAKAEQDEPYGWWRVTVNEVRDNRYKIGYEGWENHHEVLQLSMLRPNNDEPPLTANGIIRTFYDISPEISLHFAIGSVNEATRYTLQSIAHQTKLIHLNYSADQKLILIGTRGAVADATKILNQSFHDKCNQCGKLQKEMKIQSEKVDELMEKNEELNKKIMLFEGARYLVDRLNMDEMDALESKLFDAMRKVQQAKKRLLGNKYKCVVCRENAKNVLIVACKHVCLCFECEQKLQRKNCPICRTPYRKIVKLKF